MAMSDETIRRMHAGKRALAEIRLYYNAPTPAVIFRSDHFCKDGVPESLIQRAEDYIIGCAQDTAGNADKSTDEAGREP